MKTVFFITKETADNFFRNDLIFFLFVNKSLSTLLTLYLLIDIDRLISVLSMSTRLPNLVDGFSFLTTILSLTSDKLVIVSLIPFLLEDSEKGLSIVIILSSSILTSISSILSKIRLIINSSLLLPHQLDFAFTFSEDCLSRAM